MTNLTVLQAALIDAEKQKRAFDKMKAKAFDSTKQSFEPGDLRIQAEQLAALAGELRIPLTFTHPIDLRQQLEVLAGAIVETQVVTQQHELGPNRQLVRCRQIMQTAAETLVLMQGKTPSRLYHKIGRRVGGRKAQQTSSS